MTLPTVKMSTTAAASFLSGSQIAAPAQGSNSLFLKFDAKRTGEWLLGPGADPVTDEVFSLDLASLKHGYVLWHNRKPTRAFAPINQPLPVAPDPIDSDQPNEARSLEGIFIDGQQFQLEVSTVGGRNAVDRLIGEMAARSNSGSPYLFPQVKLAAGSYEHDSYGTVFTPELAPVAWFDGEGNEEALLEEEEAPKPRKRRGA